MFCIVTTAIKQANNHFLVEASGEDERYTSLIRKVALCRLCRG
jgi:hypothetical protein